VLSVTVVVTSLPSMLSSLHASQSYSTLVATGYAMFFGGLLMLGARLGDRFGHRRTILVSLAELAAGGLVAATASSVFTLAAGRSLQGAAAAASVPSALRLLTTVTADGPPRRRAIAAWSAAGAAAGASGFVIGGIVTGLASWRFIFWAYLPLAVILAAAIALSVPSADDSTATSLNLAGSAVFTAAVMTFVLATTIVTRPAGRLAGGLLLVASVVLAGVFPIVDRRMATPLFPAPLTGDRRLRQGSLGGFLNTAAQLGTALGTAVLLLIASLTSGLPGPGHPPPDLAWGVGAAVAAAGALRFAAVRSRPAVRTPHPPSRAGAGGPALSRSFRRPV
jgi:MFS family permease